MKTLRATRYVTPLREGGSLPAIVEADDSGLYVLKFRGAGQGPKALVAEVIAGELARALGLSVPELAQVEVDPALGRNEPDAEIRQLLNASVGLNLGVDYLPGSFTFSPLTPEPITAALASEIVWFDAYVMNVDRTAKNPNLLVWHRKLWLIDHGASLYFHHDPAKAEVRARDPFAAVKNHVLLPRASQLRVAESRLRPLLDDALIDRVVGEVPSAWLDEEASSRRMYRDWLLKRRDFSRYFHDEAERAFAQLV
ncbi:MAG TPA: HipA family kinase [Myxococcaceae bacterium]|nr:HipA family kinase [Myxococcaceae bacterium]